MTSNIMGIRRQLLAAIDKCTGNSVKFAREIK